MRRAAVALVAILVATGAAATGKPKLAMPKLDKGFWVVVGAAKADAVSTGPAPHFTEAAAKCGFDLFEDFSGKFIGFNSTADYVVYVNGAYKTQAEADTALARMQPCVPAAYVKYGEYAGE